MEKFDSFRIYLKNNVNAGWSYIYVILQCYYLYILRKHPEHLDFLNKVLKIRPGNGVLNGVERNVSLSPSMQRRFTYFESNIVCVCFYEYTRLWSRFISTEMLICSFVLHGRLWYGKSTWCCDLGICECVTGVFTNHKGRIHNLLCVNELFYAQPSAVYLNPSMVRNKIKWPNQNDKEYPGSKRCSKQPRLLS